LGFGFVVFGFGLGVGLGVGLGLGAILTGGGFSIIFLGGGDTWGGGGVLGKVGGLDRGVGVVDASSKT
jgi:hypothetical protein